MLNLFIEGMKRGNADVEVIYSCDFDIGDCRGCFNCWGATPGECIQDDDMKEVLSKIAEADLLVLATPVYVDGMTGSLKTLLDRSIPLIKGRFIIRDDHCRHPLRENAKAGKLALLSVCGFTEMDNFDPLVVHVEALSKNINREYVGAVLRPAAWSIPLAEQQGMDVKDVGAAISEAGYQLVTDGLMQQEALATASREVLPREHVIKMMESYFGDK